MAAFAKSWRRAAHSLSLRIRLGTSLRHERALNPQPSHLLTGRSSRSGSDAAPFVRREFDRCYELGHARGRVLVGKSQAPLAAARSPSRRGCAPFAPRDLPLDGLTDKSGPFLAIGKDGGDPLERSRRELRPNSLRPSLFASHTWPNSNIRTRSHLFSCARN
jgi:hypothetical protein